MGVSVLSGVGKKGDVMYDIPVVETGLILLLSMRRGLTKQMDPSPKRLLFNIWDLSMAVLVDAFSDCGSSPYYVVSSLWRRTCLEEAKIWRRVAPCFYE